MLLTAPTNGNASAGICSFLRYQKQSTVRQIQMKPALSALELLITKTQENVFQGNYFSSQVKSNMEAVGIMGLPPDTDHKTSYDTLSSCILQEWKWKTDCLWVRGGKVEWKIGMLGTKTCFFFQLMILRCCYLEYLLSLKPQSTEKMIWNISAEVHKDNGEIQDYAFEQKTLPLSNPTST